MERVLSPSCPGAWRRGTRAGVATEPTRRARGGGVAQTTLHPVLGLDHAQGMGSKTKPAVQSGQRHAGGRGQPPGSQTSGRKAVGLRPCSHSWSHRKGLAPVMSSGSVSSPHSPVSPPPPPDSPTECLVGRPRTERLLAIPGRFPGPDSRHRRPARWPVLVALAGL